MFSKIGLYSNNLKQIDVGENGRIIPIRPTGGSAPTFCGLQRRCMPFSYLSNVSVLT